MITGSALITLLVTLVIVGLIVFIAFWGLSQIPMPAPFAVVIKAIIVLAVVIYLISVLLGVSGHPLFR